MEVKRIFITGGLGFLGQNLVARLKPYWSITVFDREPNFRVDCDEYRGVNIIYGDVLDTSTLASHIAGHDVVVHLAAYMSSSPSIEDYFRGAEVNICGLHSLIDAMCASDVHKLFFFSSSFVYGLGYHPTEPSVETDKLIPHTGYGVSKLAAEMFLCNQKKVSFVIARPSIVCGRYDWYGQSISIFIKQALSGQIKIFEGEESTVRDYVNVDDVCNFVWHVISANRFLDEIYNVSSGERISTMTLATKIASTVETIFGKHVDVSVVPKPILTANANIPLPKLHLCNSKLQETFSMRVMMLDDYLDDYIKWAALNHPVFWK